ncbi:MAG: TRAP transporter small permease [Paracoccus sp. (in: a-proteobacteria)]|nr:TRAP transporter small permease [Paracoccus sp. (in: a-proteobacteria)]
MQNKRDASGGQQAGHDAQPRPSALRLLSTALARAELLAAGVLTFLLFALLLVNVASRFIGAPLLWADELAVLLMAMAAFLAASAALDGRQHIAVTLLPERLGPGGAAAMALIVDLVLLGFMLFLGWMVWAWFDPIALMAAGSADAFAASSFNFIYQEPTVTLGLRKFWFWLVMPVFVICGTIHCLAQVETDLRRLKGIAG